MILREAAIRALKKALNKIDLETLKKVAGEALAAVVGVEGDRLVQMLPPAGVGMKLEPVRLCGACICRGALSPD